jgi:hypothetical protein
MISGYTNPIRSMERKLAPDYAQREFHDPGLRSLRSPRQAGLGSLHHTMPHLRRLMTAETPHFDAGGAVSNPVGRMYAASHSTIDPADAYYRQVLSALSQPAFNNPALRSLPSTPTFAYQEGGAAPEEEQEAPDMQEVEAPEDQLSPQEQQERKVVLNAMAALEGQSPDPTADLKAFVDTFGPRALGDLQQLLEEKHQTSQQDDEEDEEEPDDEEEEIQTSPQAEEAGFSEGGGLLRGPGTGQSDEIEGTTPSGRPVLLSDGEYVIDAPTVAALGDGSTDAGARRLDALRKQIRQSTYGSDKQAKPMAKGKGGALVLRIP